MSKKITIRKISELTEDYHIIGINTEAEAGIISTISKDSKPSEFFYFELPENIRDFLENRYEGSLKMREIIQSKVQKKIQYAIGLIEYDEKFEL